MTDIVERLRMLIASEEDMLTDTLRKAADEIERLRAALLNLASAADDVGVQFFDTDTMHPLVEKMQTATQAARAALGDKPPQEMEREG